MRKLNGNKRPRPSSKYVGRDITLEGTSSLFCSLIPLTSLRDIICWLYFHNSFQKMQTSNLPSKSILYMAKGSLYWLFVPLTKQNERKHLCHNSPDRFSYIWPHRQYTNIFVNYKWITKDTLQTVSTSQTDKKAHARKSTILVAFSAKNIPSNLAENSELYLLLPK